jgi:hypothetical protein
MSLVPVPSLSRNVICGHVYRQIFESASYVSRRNTIHPSMFDRKGQWQVSRLSVTRGIAFPASEERRLRVGENEGGIVFQTIDFEANSANKSVHSSSHNRPFTHLPPIFSANSNVIKTPGLINHDIPLLVEASCKTASAPDAAPSKLKILAGFIYDLLEGARILLSQDPGKMVSRGNFSKSGPGREAAVVAK